MKPNIKKIEEELDNFRNVKYRMGTEGVDYCFVSYSSFKEIKDEEFHKLRNNYLENMEKIRSYVDKKVDELESQVEDLEWGDY